jgi:phage gp36-like protein
MRYADPADLARVATGGWTDLAQRAARDARVTGELIRALADGADTSAWPADVVQLGQYALVVIEDTLDRASRHADTYINPRFKGPLTADLIAASDLPTVVATIAYRRLFGTPISKDLADGTRWADDYLRDLAAGRVSLGQHDAQGADPETRAEFSPRQITDETLRGF